MRRCLPMDLSISANRKALGSLTKNEDGGAIVPKRLSLPYLNTNTHDEVAAKDWTLFKPAAFYPPVNAGDESHAASHSDSDDDILMGMKVVSVRCGNPSIGKPTVPATAVLVNAETGEVNAILGATFLTAARTASGSAIATDICTQHAPGSINLLIFGAGLQAECHIEAIRCVKSVGRITIVNRTPERAHRLKEKLLTNIRQQGGEGGCESLVQGESLSVVALDDIPGVESAVGDADVIVTATNTAKPLFRGEWLKPGCHINGVGSYTSSMQEVDETLVNRCQVLVDTKEALSVGDLKHLNVNMTDGTLDKNFAGLLGDAIAGNLSVRHANDGYNTDCTFFKSVGTAIQDVITAHEVLKMSNQLGIGRDVDM